MEGSPQASPIPDNSELSVIMGKRLRIQGCRPIVSVKASSGGSMSRQPLGGVVSSSEW